LAFWNHEVESATSPACDFCVKNGVAPANASQCGHGLTLLASAVSRSEAKSAFWVTNENWYNIYTFSIPIA
jgi:hypothetical protein